MAKGKIVFANNGPSKCEKVKLLTKQIDSLTKQLEELC